MSAAGTAQVDGTTGTRAGSYLTLTKPGITAFVSFAAVAGFIAASGGGQLMRMLAVALATASMSGGAAALNHVEERESDARMRRTASRPVPAGVISPRAATVFAWSLSLAGFAFALYALPLTAAACLAAAHVSYVYVYTPLKRRTSLCTLVGAVPGALPALAGWAAAGRGIDSAGLALTGVLFAWQIPHFLALGWIARDDYRAAGCPMLGVVDASGASSARMSILYAATMLICGLALARETQAGALFTFTAIVTGTAYVVSAWRFHKRHEPAFARRLFLSSLLVLPLFLAGLITDVLLLR